MSEHEAAIDHILLGVANLDDGIREFENLTGLTAVRGGRHPSRGTENALISLGDNSYLEIIATRDDAANPNDFEKYLRTLDSLTLVGWAIQVRDIDDAQQRIRTLGFQPLPAQLGSRLTPNGEKLEWTLFLLERPKLETAPLFIRWSPSTTHPAKSSPVGCSIVFFTLGEPNVADLSRLVSAFDVPVRTSATERPEMRLRLRCGTREVEFQSDRSAKRQALAW